jgi:hypothetical protein
VGESGTILHGTDAGWINHDRGPRGSTLWTVWGIDENHLWAAGEKGIYQRKNGAWGVVSETAGRPFDGLTGSAPDDAWASRDDGMLFHFDGQMWTRMYSAGYFSGAWCPDAGVVIGVGDFGARRCDLTGCTTSLARDAGTLLSVHGLSENEIWAVGDDAVYRNWSPIPTPNYGLHAVHVFSSDEVWVGGGAAAHAWRFRADGGIEPLNAPHNIEAIYATAPNDVWAVGQYQFVMHYDGTGWSDTPVPTDTAFYGITGFANSIWVAGTNGAILRRARR